MILFFLLVLLISPAGFAAQYLPEEEVVVTANAYPVPFENLSRTVTVLTQEDIANLPAHSVSDVLAQAISADIASRSPFGMQSDIKLRGSAFSQVLVMVDGVRMNDSQTGHHNADFPVQLQDIDRIEVLLGAGSSIYGADAVGGIVNIITRRSPKAGRASVAAGQNGFVEGSFSAGFQKGTFGQSISASGNRASGFMYDRDFHSVSVSARSSFGEHTALFVSHARKEFGANGFYGPAPSREWTNQTLVSFEHAQETRPGATIQWQGFYRTHGDRFLYDVRTPGLYENRHRTHAAGVSAKGRFSAGDAMRITLGAEAGGDWIVSSNLGDHAFGRTSLFSELQWNFGKKVALYPGVRWDYYSTFGSAVNPSLSASAWVLPRLRVRSSIGRAFRIPTFTELYYRDPNHEANARLRPERAWSAEAGADVIPAENWMGSITFFLRKERDVIDWIRTSAAEKWRTSNIHRLRSEGVELGLERTLGLQARVGARYSYISMDAGAVAYTSKYVLDYARHTWTSSFHTSLPAALKYRQSLSYKRRADGRGYWVMNGGLDRSWHKFVTGLEYTNLLNSSYQEIRGVDMPGRWLILSLRTR